MALFIKKAKLGVSCFFALPILQYIKNIFLRYAIPGLESGVSVISGAEDGAERQRPPPVHRLDHHGLPEVRQETHP